MKTAIVIPHITTRPEQLKMITECLDSFARHHPSFDGKIIVVDDSSKEPYKTQLQELCSKRGIDYLYNEVNKGFPPTANRGIRHALETTDCDYVTVVNNDIVFTQEVKENFDRAFSIHPKIGLVGALLFYPHGTIQHGGILWIGKNAFTHRSWHKTLDQSPEAQTTEYMIAVTGALFGMRREMLQEIGPFRDDYFLAFDDVEMCYRAWHNDWRVLYSPTIKAIHKEGATRGRTDNEKKTKYRVWYLKELETHAKFTKDMAQYDHDANVIKVEKANAELKGMTPQDVTIKSDRMIFNSSEVKFVGTGDPARSKPIIVKRTGALGDVLLATAVIRELKLKNPEKRIVVSTSYPEVFRDNVHVDQIIGMMNETVYDSYYDLDLCYERVPKVNIVEAYAKMILGTSQFSWQPEIFSNDADYNSALEKLKSIDFSKDRVAVLHMGHAWPSRTWPKSKWNEVSQSLSAHGYKVIVVGKGKDFRSDLYTNVFNMVDQFTIHEIKEIIKRSQVFVGNDSGLIHVAQATDTPIVGIFTVANPKFRIVPRGATTVALIPKVDCKFCLHDYQPPVTNMACRFGTNHCLNDIKPSDVLDAVAEVCR